MQPDTFEAGSRCIPAAQKVRLLHAATADRRGRLPDLGSGIGSAVLDCLVVRRRALDHGSVPSAAGVSRHGPNEAEAAP